MSTSKSEDREKAIRFVASPSLSSPSASNNIRSFSSTHPSPAGSAHFHDAIKLFNWQRQRYHHLAHPFSWQQQQHQRYLPPIPYPIFPIPASRHTANFRGPSPSHPFYHSQDDPINVISPRTDKDSGHHQHHSSTSSSTPTLISSKVTSTSASAASNANQGTSEKMIVSTTQLHTLLDQPDKDNRNKQIANFTGWPPHVSARSGGKE